MASNDSLISTASSTTSMCGGSDEPVFDELRRGRDEVVAALAEFNDEHALLRHQGRTRHNMERREACDEGRERALQMIKRLHARANEAIEQNPGAVTDTISRNIHNFIARREKATEKRVPLGPSHYDDEDEEDDGEDYIAGPVLRSRTPTRKDAGPPTASTPKTFIANIIALASPGGSSKKTTPSSNLRTSTRGSERKGGAAAAQATAGKSVKGKGKRLQPPVIDLAASVASKKT